MDVLDELLTSAITDAFRNNRLTRRYTRHYLINEEEYDDLSATLLLEIVTSFGSPGNDSFMKLYKKTQIKNLGKYKKVKDPELCQSCCPICIDNFKENEYFRELSCKHVFHKKCIDRWFKKDHSDCPMCRTKIIN